MIPIRTASSDRRRGLARVGLATALAAGLLAITAGSAVSSAVASGSPMASSKSHDFRLVALGDRLRQRVVGAPPEQTRVGDIRWTDGNGQPPD